MRRADPARVPAVSDGCILRILEGLMTLKARRDARAAVLPRTRRRTDRLGLRDSDGIHCRDCRRAGARDQGRQEQPHAGVRRSRRARSPPRARTASSSSKRRPTAVSFRRMSARRWKPPRSVADLAAALDPIVDERGSPRKHEIAPARRSCSRPTSAGAPAATTRRAALPSRSYAMRWSRRSSGSGRMRRLSRFSISRSAIRPWAPAPSSSRPAARSRRGWCRRGTLTKTRSRPSRRTRTRSCTRAAWSRSAASMASTRTRSPPISPSCRYGSRRSRATTSSPSSITRLNRGDSLVGLTQAQIAAAHWDTSKPGLPLFRQLVNDRVAEAMKGRAEIQAAPDDTARAIQEAAASLVGSQA